MEIFEKEKINYNMVLGVTKEEILNKIHFKYLR